MSKILVGLVIVVLASYVYYHNSDPKAIKTYSLPIVIDPEVQHALDNNLPVVALESTIITHG